MLSTHSYLTFCTSLYIPSILNCGFRVQKRREESISTEHEESVRQQILEGFMAEWVLNNPEYTREMATFSSPLTTKKLPPRLTYSDLSTKVTVKLSAAAV